MFERVAIPGEISTPSNEERPWASPGVSSSRGRRRGRVPALGGATAKLPTRTLGKTGIEVSILGFGSGSRFLMYEDEDKALEALSQALDLGITYIDTAHSYGDGKSEERIGRLMPERRKQITLATKLSARTADDARRQIELSLKRLQTDRLDVLHIHALAGPDDLAAIEKPDGVLKALYEARDQKVTRAIGITCHAAPAALKTALERHDFDCTQMALNAAMARMADGRGGMKATPMAAGRLRGAGAAGGRPQGDGRHRHEGLRAGADRRGGPDREAADLLALAARQPGELGMPKPEFIERNIELARAFTPMSGRGAAALTDSIAAERKVSLATFFRAHQDA